MALPPSLSDLMACSSTAWRQHAQWRVLLSDWQHGLGLLALWQHWRQAPNAPQMLHVVALCADDAQAQLHLDTLPPALQPLAQRLQAQLWGLLPGVHRITLEDGRLQLTLWVGDRHQLLRQQHLLADAVWLDASYACDHFSIKAITRHCQRGTCLALDAATPQMRQAWLQAGFAATSPSDTSTGALHYAPRWEPRQRQDMYTHAQPVGHALVVGAGLAGSSIAYSLALRGWQVSVLGLGETPADGASSLPAGLFCPHVSPDDSVLSRLSRSGVRQTLSRLQALCTEHQDWAPTGVLEHCTDGGTGLPAQWTQQAAALAWSQPATPEHLAAAHLPAETVACWHARAGWVRPAQLVRAQLNHPCIRFVPHAPVAQLLCDDAGHWQALDAQGHVLASAALAILACGPATAQLLPGLRPWYLQALRGQVTWQSHAGTPTNALPPFPVNGNGNLVTQVPMAGGQPHWVMGSTFERDVDRMPITAQEQAQAHQVNHEKLCSLVPHSGALMAPWFTPGDARCQPTWGRVRCASSDRLPIAGPVDPESAPGLWALTALGARGLTLSMLCAELMAARLHGEPLPLDAKLALHLGSERLQP